MSKSSRGRFAVVIGTASCVLLLTAACSASAPTVQSGSLAETGSPASSAASAPASTPSAASPTLNIICDQAALGQALAKREREETLVRLTTPTCSGGWAVSTAIYRVTGSAATTVESVVVFRESASGWSQQDREASCQLSELDETIRTLACASE